MKNRFYKVDYKDLSRQLKVMGFGVYSFSIIKRVFEGSEESKPLSNYIRMCQKAYIPNWLKVSVAITNETRGTYSPTQCRLIFEGKRKSEKVQLMIENILKGAGNEEAGN